MILLTRSDLQRCLTMRDCIDAMREAFAQLSSGQADVPQRIGLAAGAGISLFMPAHLRGSHALGLKVVSVHDENAARKLPAILALVVLVDEQSGEPLALLDGTFITATRTAAGSGLATEYLARADAKVAAIIGAGPQALAHAAAMCAVRPIQELRIVSRHPEHAQHAADELRASLSVAVRAVDSAHDALAGADIVCCCTNSAIPVFEGADLRAGTHINAVGAFTPTTRETDDETLRRVSRIVVDSRATIAHEAGDIVIPLERGIIGEQKIYAELGEIVLGQKSGRSRPDEITLFKSVGNAAQDVAAASTALSRARELGIGAAINLFA